MLIDGKVPAAPGPAGREARSPADSAAGRHVNPAAACNCSRQARTVRHLPALPGQHLYYGFANFPAQAFSAPGPASPFFAQHPALAGPRLQTGYQLRAGHRLAPATFSRSTVSAPIQPSLNAPTLLSTVAPLDESLPIIYATRRTQPHHLTGGARLLASVIAAAGLGLLLVAAWVRPNAAGVGTHASSLHLQPCQFLERTGLPCPSCGMTTSFAWFARGNVPASLYVQPMGTVLAALTACSVWVASYVALTGRPVYRLLRLVPGRYYLLPLLALGLIAWAWKTLLRLKGLDGWG